ncbi:unnamed protein product [Soboliphyme baturini]|uniref:Solute carrier family 12 member 9 n=1 Tax=Soboliphyme baturini TaxID=241478 RepID=A0A183ISM2_9BILA|nr:unnamed protein product [Soboliphyme baturini]
MTDKLSEITADQHSSRRSSIDSSRGKHSPFRVRFCRSTSELNLSNLGDSSSIEDKFDERESSLETVPDIHNYKKVMSVKWAVIPRRPSLNELHSTFAIHVDSESELKAVLPGDTSPVPRKSAPSKFGWIEGVFLFTPRQICQMRDVLNIIGVMLFLRLSWVTGLAGIGFASGIVLLSSTITVITTLSTCAICTNGKVRGGGVYFIISRSLGPEFGGSIGIIFFAANAVGAAVYMAGFAETVLDILRREGVKIIDGDVNDMRIIGWATAVVMLCIVITGISFESKAQIVLMVTLLASLVNFFIGTFFEPTPEQELKGVTGYNLDTLSTNFGPDWRGYSFFTLLAIYFPAATGFLAGVNISGDLRKPEKAIPKGTLLSLLCTTILYLVVVWVSGSTCQCTANHTCEYGLANDFQVVRLESAFGHLTTAGIFASTLSSALASLVSAPKVLQTHLPDYLRRAPRLCGKVDQYIVIISFCALFRAIAEDKLFPKLEFFAKGYGKSNEPRRGYVFSFILIVLASFVLFGFVSLIIRCAIGRVNDISPIITNFFMASYALINYACFEASFARSPGFRPAFKYYNMWLSMLGAVMCVVLMFTINPWTALLTISFIFLLHSYISHRKTDTNWGSSSQAVSYRSALQKMFSLQLTPAHVKNYRPQVLVMTGNPTARPGLVNFVSSITKKNSLMLCGHVIKVRFSHKLLVLVLRHNQLRALDISLCEFSLILDS